MRFFFQAEDGIRDSSVTGVQTCALPIYTNVSGLRANPGQDGDPHVLVLIKRSGSQCPISHSRFPERRSTVRPSHFHHPQTSSALRAGSARLADPLSYDAVAAFMLNFSPRRITAQAIRASLAASATTTVFTCARASRPRNHALCD